MKMENLFFLLFLATLFSCSPITNKLNYNENHKLESKGGLRFYSKETQMMYDITNDANNLYICIKADDEQIQRSIMMKGMGIFIDTCKKSKQEIGVLYPLSYSKGTKPQPDGQMKMPLKPDSLQNMNGGKDHKRDFNNQRNNFNKQQRLMQLVGFKNMESDILPIENNKGIIVKMDWDSSKTLVYKAVIPFKTFYKEQLTANDTNKIFTFTIIASIVKMPTGNGMPPFGNGMPPSGSGRQGPPMGQQGGMQGGFGGGGSGDRPSMEEGGQRGERPAGMEQPTSQQSKHEMHFKLSFK